MTICADCGKDLDGIDRLCPDCAEEFGFIVRPKITGWTEQDDDKLDAALNEIGLRQNEKWTAALRLTSVDRIVINWCMDDINYARERIKELAARSLNQFQGG